MPLINLRTPAVHRNKWIHVHHTQTPWTHGHLNDLLFFSKSLPSPFKITLKNKRLSAVVINWIEMMMPLSLLKSFAGVVSKPPRHCPSCVKRCRCAYTGGTWLLRCCQLLLHLFLATCNKRAPDCSGASQCLLPHPQPLSYFFFQNRAS